MTPQASPDIAPDWNPRIAILGVGAIGSSVGADLIIGGHDVTLIDGWRAHIDVIAKQGLTVQTPKDEQTIMSKALHTDVLAHSIEPFDLVFLACKSNDSDRLCGSIAPHIRDDGVLVALQNGMNDDAIANLLGKGRNLGAVVELSAEVFTPGVIKRNTPVDRTWFALGELDGQKTARLEAIRSILSAAGSVELRDDIRSTKWTKVLANSMTMGPFGLLGLYNHAARDIPGMFDVSLNLGLETLTVGLAEGFTVQPIFGLTAADVAGPPRDALVRIMTTLLEHVSAGRTAPIHDHLKGRHSEIAYINGAVCRMGARHGIPTPFNNAVVELDRRINAGALAMSSANFDLLRQLATS